MWTNQKIKAQSVLEYALIISVLVAALIGMQVYLTRSMQGRLKEIANELSSQHYVAGHTTSDITFTSESDNITESASELNEAKDRIISTSRTTINNEVQTRQGYEQFEE